MKNKNFIFDFDSTFVQVEALDELAAIALRGNPEKERIVAEIKRITELGMEGKITFQESLSRRLQLFHIKQEHITELISLLSSKISSSVLRNKNFFLENSESIYIISGGFKEYISPVVSSFGIREAHVLANTFVIDSENNVTDYDKANFLSQPNGKVLQVQALNLEGQVFVIGDGYTDYQIKALGKADTFFAYTENIVRDSVVEKADMVANSLDSVIAFVKN